MDPVPGVLQEEGAEAIEIENELAGVDEEENNLRGRLGFTGDSGEDEDFISEFLSLFTVGMRVEG